MEIESTSVQVYRKERSLKLLKYRTWRSRGRRRTRPSTWSVQTVRRQLMTSWWSTSTQWRPTLSRCRTASSRRPARPHTIRWRLGILKVTSRTVRWRRWLQLSSSKKPHVM